MNQKGFSLFEMIIVMAIMAIMSSIVVASYSNSRELERLSLSAKQIANDVRVAQNYSFSALEIGGENSGYGIRFTDDSDSYVIFIDKDSNRVRTDGSEDFQTIKFTKGVKIKSLRVGVVNDVPLADVVFTSPYGRTYVNGNPVNLEIVIENSAGIKTIYVSGFGKVN